jgi:hypothetical protein
MYADMAFIQVGNHRFRQWARVFCLVDKLRINRFFTDQNGDAGTLGFIILTRDVQNIGANN